MLLLSVVVALLVVVEIVRLARWTTRWRQRRAVLRFWERKLVEHRAWTLMNKPDGSFFGTFEEFCEHRQPWGLGKPWPEIKPALPVAEQLRVAADMLEQDPPLRREAIVVAEHALRMMREVAR